MPRPELAQYYSEKDDDGRGYKHPFRTFSNDKPVTVPSVTAVLKMENKDSLIQWAVNKTMEWAVDHVSSIYTQPRESAIKSGAYQWKNFRDERASVGTGIHETIQSEHDGLWNYPELDEEQSQIMYQWRKLQERYVITPHLSEFTVFGNIAASYAVDNDYKWGYAGTVDGYWDILDTKTGVLYENLYVDIKTSKGTWPGHWMQLAALWNADTKMTKVDPAATMNPKNGLWAPDSWMEEPNLARTGVAIVHLRADMAEILIEQDRELLDAYAMEFGGYHMAWVGERKVRDVLKNREAAF